MNKRELLPESIYHERLVLGGVLVQPERMAEIAEIITADDFALEKHKRIWQRMVALAEMERPVDRATVAQSLQDHGELESCDGVSYLVSLDEALPALFALDEYARVVSAKARLRTLYRVAEAMQGRILAGTETPEEVTAWADEQLGFIARDRSARDFVTPDDVIRRAGGLDGYLSRRRSPGVDSPWPRLNKVMVDLQPGDLCIVAAPPGGGKTTFASQWAYHVAQKHIGVAVFSLEMSADQLTDKAISQLGEVNGYALRRMCSAEERGKIMAGATLATERPVFYCDTADLTVSGIKNAVKRLRQRSNIGLVVVDYLQLMSGKGHNRYEQVSGVARGLKNAAMTLGIPVMALSQFSRAYDEGEVPKITWLRDSGEIEQAANQIVAPWGKFSYENEPDEWLPVAVYLLKNRGGDTGKSAMQWRKDIGIFREVA